MTHEATAVIRTANPTLPLITGLPFWAATDIAHALTACELLVVTATDGSTWHYYSRGVSIPPSRGRELARQLDLYADA